MGKKKRGYDEYDSFERAMLLEMLVERLCHQITNCHHNNPDPDMAITVDVARTDDKAKERGWPSAKIMQEGVNQALKNLPKNIVERIELDEV